MAHINTPLTGMSLEKDGEGYLLKLDFDDKGKYFETKEEAFIYTSEKVSEMMAYQIRVLNECLNVHEAVSTKLFKPDKPKRRKNGNKK